MEKFHLYNSTQISSPSNNETNYKSKVAFDDFLVVEDYFIIKESSSTLSVFKFSKTKAHSAELYKEITLKNQKEVKCMDAINTHNVFIVYHTNDICVIDLESSSQEEVSVFLKDKTPLPNVNEISIHDQCNLKDSGATKTIYLGLVSVNNKDLYLAYKDWNSKNYILNCIQIKKFNEEIIHLEYKFITSDNNKKYCFICVLCKFEGYTFLSEINENYDINQFVEILKKEDKWTNIFKEKTILKYYYSFYYSLETYKQNSILIYTEEDKCLIWKFQQNLESADYLAKTEHQYKFNKTINNDIINVIHYDNKLFIITKKKMIVYKLNSSLATPCQTLDLKNVIGIVKTKIFDVPNLVYVLIMTNNDIFYHQIDLNEAHLKRVSSNISLGGLGVEDSEKLKPVDLSNKIKNTTFNLENSNVNAAILKTDLTSLGGENKTNKEEIKTNLANSNANTAVSDISNNIINTNTKNKENQMEVAQGPMYKCAVCEKPARYRCHLCKKYFMCEDGEHPTDWQSHVRNCPSITKRKNIEKLGKLDNYEALWNKQRQVIIELLLRKDYQKAIEKTDDLIQENFNTLERYQEEKRILPFKDLECVKLNKDDNIFNSYLFYEDYFCNLLLLIHAFNAYKSKDEVWRLLKRLVNEMETYHFKENTNLLIETYVEKMAKNKIPQEEVQKFQNAYLRILRIIVTIAKYGNSLGEFNFYENYLLDYVEKIMEMYSNEPYICYNTYLLLGNLYVEYGMLKKGYMLYETIIENNNVSNKNKENLNDVVLCANYNSGLINFIIDKYEIAKQRLETALIIKKELLKEKNDIQISKIYETLSEIDIEYKNYSSAFINLQKAIESRELSNTSDNEFKLKAQELRNYLDQNSTDNKGDVRSKIQLRKGHSTEETENEKIIMNLIGDLQINNEKSPDIQELEKFFLLVTKLSNEQIKKLNDDQPEDYEKNKFFPIVFSRNFKNSLTHNQRLALCDLRLTSLTRVNVLKNYLKKITIKNLNYNALNLVPPENNLNSIRNLFVTKNILKNWEIKDGDEVKIETSNRKDARNIKELAERNKSELGLGGKKVDALISKERFEDKKYEMIENDNKIKEKEKEEEEESKKNSENSEYSSEKQSKMPASSSQFSGDEKKNSVVLDKEPKSINISPRLPTSTENVEKQKVDFDYNSLLQSIINYCNENCPEKKNYIDEKFFFLLCRENLIKKEEMVNIEKNPELIDILLNTYIEMINGASKDAAVRNKSQEFIQEECKGLCDDEIIKAFLKEDSGDEKEPNKIPLPPPLPPKGKIKPKPPS